MRDGEKGVGQAEWQRSVRDAVINAHQIKSRAEVCNRERNHFLNQVSVVYP